MGAARSPHARPTTACSGSKSRARSHRTLVRARERGGGAPGPPVAGSVHACVRAARASTMRALRRPGTLAPCRGSPPRPGSRGWRLRPAARDSLSGCWSTLESSDAVATRLRPFRCRRKPTRHKRPRSLTRPLESLPRRNRKAARAASLRQRLATAPNPSLERRPRQAGASESASAGIGPCCPRPNASSTRCVGYMYASPLTAPQHRPGQQRARRAVRAEGARVAPVRACRAYLAPHQARPSPSRHVGAMQRIAAAPRVARMAAAPGGAGIPRAPVAASPKIPHAPVCATPLKNGGIVIRRAG